MIKDKAEMRIKPIEIDLTGPEGNVFVLMSYARDFAKQIWGRERTRELDEAKKNAEVLIGLGMEDEDLEKTPDTMGELIVKQMMSADYDNAVEVFDKYFGSFVILYK